MMQRLLYCLILMSTAMMAQAQASLASSAVDSVAEVSKKSTVSAEQFILPGLALTYGCLSLQSQGLQNFDQQLQSRLAYKNQAFPVDDFIQYLPVAAVIGLNIAGVEGKHKLRDQAIILGTSAALTIATVSSIKKLAGRSRPNSFAQNSFPSGHTATAFVGATFLWMEYKDSYPWYGIAGYTIAIGTGLLRMYNNKHWFSDVVMGAGLGILNTRLAYWLYPSLQRLLFKDSTKHQAMLLPLVSRHTFGLYFNWQL